MLRKFRSGLLILPIMAVLAVSCGGNDTVTPPAQQADLVIQAVTFAPAQPIPGQTVTVHATVRNAGDAAAIATRTRVRVDGTATCAEIQTGTLAAGATVEVTCSAGALSLGAHPVEVCADITGLVTESNEQNNCTTGSLTVVAGPPPPAGSDLVVQTISFNPPNPTPGQTVTATVRVKNNGSAAAGAGATEVKLDGAVRCAQLATPALNSGATADVTCDLGSLTAGTYQLGACADITALVAESDEQNNCATASLTVSSTPPPAEADLMVQSITLSPPNPTPGQTVTATVRVKNNGSTAAGASATEVKLNGAVRCADLATPAISPGATADVTCDLGAATSGTHQVDACADKAAQIPEANETNNCLSVSITVAAAGPDLPQIPDAPLEHPVVFCSTDPTALEIEGEVQSQISSAEGMASIGRSYLAPLYSADWTDAGGGCYTWISAAGACSSAYRICRAGDGFDYDLTLNGNCWTGQPVQDWHVSSGHVRADGREGRAVTGIDPTQPDSVMTYTWHVSDDGKTGEYKWYFGSEDPAHLYMSMDFEERPDGTFFVQWQVMGAIKWELTVSADGRTGTWDYYMVDYAGGGGWIPFQHTAWANCHGSRTTTIAGIPPQVETW